MIPSLFLNCIRTLDLTHDPVAFKLTKHILRHAYELRDRVARTMFLPSFVETSAQLADILTKALRPAQHALLRGRILPGGVVAH